MKLLVDFGNTRLKWALLDAGQLRPGGAFAHADRPLPAALEEAWSALAGIDAVFVASVVGAAPEAELAAHVRTRFRLATAFPRTPAAALGIRNAYAEPARLGFDRFLGLAALHAGHAEAQMLVSVGTALTLDAVDARGDHLGGAIVASPRLMREVLLGATARIGAADGQWHALPASTADGVMTGSLYAAAGAVDRFRAAAAEKLGTMPKLWLTGGGAGELAPLLPDAQPAHDLVLRGLALWATDGTRVEG